MKQWMSVAFVQDSYPRDDHLTLDLGLRYDRQTLTDATTNFAPRLGFALASAAPIRALVDSRRLRDVLHADPRQRAGRRADGRPRRHHHLHGDARADRFPTCLTACLPVQFDPRTLPLTQQPARNITIQAGAARTSTSSSSRATA